MAKAFLIFLIGFFFRLAWLGQYPVGFYSNEALLGYRGKLLAQELVDETGRKLPLIFTSFQGYQLPFSSYLVALSVKLFGLNEWAVRLPFAIVSCLGLIAIFSIIRLLFPKEKQLAFWTTVVMAVSPGAIFLSRFPSDWNLVFNLFLLGFWLFLFLIKKRRLKFLFFILFLSLLFSLSIFFSYLRLPGASKDFTTHQLGFFTDSTILNGVNQMRGEDLRAGKPLLGRLFYNKSFYVTRLVATALDHFKPQFYFASGDGNSLHGLSNFGPILPVFLPLFLAGVYFLFQKNDLAQKKKLLISWFLLGIIPSVFSLPSPDQEKLIFVFPVLAILIGYTASRLKRYQRGWLVVFLILNFGFVFYDAFYKEPLRTQQVWSYGAKQLAEKLQSQSADFDQILVTDSYTPDLGPQLLFYFHYPSQKLWRETNLEEGRVFYHQWISQIGKIKIGQLNSWQIKAGEKGLLVITPQEKWILAHYRFLAKNGRPSKKTCFQLSDQIVGLDGKPIYLLAAGISDHCLLRIESEKEK